MSQISLKHASQRELPLPLRTILVVDDSRTNLRVTELTLRQKFQVLQASDAASAMKMAALHQPDLILLDVKMPGMSGPDFLHALKMAPETEGIPAVLFTAGVQSDEIEFYKQLPVLGVVRKPFDPLKLCQELEELYLLHYSTN